MQNANKDKETKNTFAFFKVSQINNILLRKRWITEMFWLTWQWAVRQAGHQGNSVVQSHRTASTWEKKDSVSALLSWRLQGAPNINRKMKRRTTSWKDIPQLIPWRGRSTSTHRHQNQQNEPKLKWVYRLSKKNGQCVRISKPKCAFSKILFLSESKFISAIRCKIWAL